MEEVETLRDMNSYKNTKIASLKRKLKRETARRKRNAAGDSLDLSSDEDEDAITVGDLSDAGSSIASGSSAKTGLKKASRKKNVSWKEDD